MIYVLIPNSIETFSEIRVFENFGGAEHAMKEGARTAPDPNWCRVFAYTLTGDEYSPCWIFTVTPSMSIKREPSQSP